MSFNINTLVQVRTTEARGRSLFARVAVSAGRRLLIEEPLIYYKDAEEWEDRDEDDEEYKEAVANAIERLHHDLTRGKKAQFARLYGTEDDIFSKFDTNCWLYRDSAQSKRDAKIVYHNLSMVNHSCRPNAHVAYNPRIEKGTLYAIKDIAAGEEVLVDYNSLNYHYTSKERNDYLRKQWGFECRCASCVPPRITERRKEREMERILGARGSAILRRGTISNARRARVKKLYEATMNWETGAPLVKNTEWTRAQTVEDFEEIFGLMREEGLVATDQIGLVLKEASTFHEKQMRNVQKAHSLCQQARDVAAMCLGVENETVDELDAEVRRLRLLARGARAGTIGATGTRRSDRRKSRK